jgi:glyoxylase-like metal-dependent hydrolase (beta-lactamase superfamily II)
MGVKGQASYSPEAVISQEPNIHSVFESETGTWQYVVADPSTMTAAIIDPVLDYDPATQVITTQTADSLLSLVKEKGYRVAWILETHAHADHLTASSYLQKHLTQKQGRRPPIGIGKLIGKVQELFGKRYGVPAKEYEGAFDKLFDDDEEFEIGNLRATAIRLPGHTPDHLGYKIGGKASTVPIVSRRLTAI